jgi:hypothetical protein
MRRRLQLTVAVAVLAVLGVVAVAVATNGARKVDERLTGYAEQPLALSTTGSGHFQAWFNRSAQEIRYRLSYRNLEGPVTQAHIHFGAPNQVGGVSVFLCTNLGNGPAGTQACPAAPATITGTVTPADVIGPTSQGIEPGSMPELIRALRAGEGYVNVHSTRFPAGEIRAQINDRNQRQPD